MSLRRIASIDALLFVAILWCSTPVSAQSEYPFVGSWKLNVAKSKMGKEAPPQSLISKIEVEDGHARMTGVRIGSDGIRSEARFKAKLDGKDYPLTGHSHADTISLKRIDARTIERVDKKAGKVVETSVTVYSEDGKTSTTTGKATNLRGDDFHYIVVNEKQAEVTDSTSKPSPR
jgi:hypothetical protein